MPKRHWLQYQALLVSIVLTLPTAHAQPRAADPAEQRARELFRKAEVHFNLGEFDRALTLYKDAYRIKQMPEFLFNIGQCQRFMGACDRAVFSYRQFLLHKPDSPQQEQIQQLIRQCEEKIAAMSQTNEPAGSAPESTVEKDPRQPRAAPATSQAQPRRLSRAWFWTGVGVTGALAISGIVTAVMAREKNDESLDPSTAMDRRKELKDSGEALEITSWITLGLAAGAAAGTVALYFMSHPRPCDADRTIAVSPVVLPGGGAVVFEGRF